MGGRQTLWPGRGGEEVAYRTTVNVNECYRWCVSTMVPWTRSSLARASDCTSLTEAGLSVTLNFNLAAEAD